MEEKTLPIRKGEMRADARDIATAWIPGLARLSTSSSGGRSWTRGGSDGAEEPKQCCEERTRKREGVAESRKRYPFAEASGVLLGARFRPSGPKQTGNPRCERRITEKVNESK